uniref:Uncharacterized protein n=1 Tax=Rhizophora mucronata TaxID=61149 RepID=A0A2P2N089_RHIMU
MFFPLLVQCIPRQIWGRFAIPFLAPLKVWCLHQHLYSTFNLE